MTSIYQPPPPPPSPEPAALDERAAARLIGISPRKLWQLRRDGRGPRYCRVGCRIIYPRHLLIEWLNATATQA
jgi:hypothetical protein